MATACLNVSQGFLAAASRAINGERKMANFFERLMGRGSRRSGSKAKERLQLVLIHDRLNLPPERLEEMKQEIMAVISKYVSVDAKNVDIALRQRDRDS